MDDFEPNPHRRLNPELAGENPMLKGKPEGKTATGQKLENWRDVLQERGMELMADIEQHGELYGYGNTVIVLEAALQVCRNRKKLEARSKDFCYPGIGVGEFISETLDPRWKK